MHMHRKVFQLLLLSALAAQASLGIDNLMLNPRLNYHSDSLDGPLVTGDDAEAGLLPGKTNYVIIYGEGCFNSKRQARRTVELYEKYRQRVHFVVVDLDLRRSPAQQRLVHEYYQGYIPQVVVLDARGRALYDASGEVEARVIADIFERSFAGSGVRSQPRQASKRDLP